jgi:hypothetical protein
VDGVVRRGQGLAQILNAVYEGIFIATAFCALLSESTNTRHAAFKSANKDKAIRVLTGVIHEGDSIGIAEMFHTTSV